MGNTSSHQRFTYKRDFNKILKENPLTKDFIWNPIDPKKLQVVTFKIFTESGGLHEYLMCLNVHVGNLSKDKIEIQKIIENTITGFYITTENIPLIREEREKFDEMFGGEEDIKHMIDIIMNYIDFNNRQWERHKKKGTYVKYDELKDELLQKYFSEDNPGEEGEAPSTAIPPVPQYQWVDVDEQIGERAHGQIGEIEMNEF